VDQSSPFFAQHGRVVVDRVFFPDFPYVYPFRRYSRSKSKVVKNHAEIWTFGLTKFMGRAFQKLYPHYHPFLAIYLYIKLQTGRRKLKSAVVFISSYLQLLLQFACNSIKTLKILVLSLCYNMSTYESSTVLQLPFRRNSNANKRARHLHAYSRLQRFTR